MESAEFSGQNRIALMTAQGYQITEAGNGKTALELAPDLVILDLGLPDIQGHELLRTTAASPDGFRWRAVERPRGGGAKTTRSEYD